MNERALIYFLVFIIWSQLSWRWYTTEIKGFYRYDARTDEASSHYTEHEENAENHADDRALSFQLEGDRAILFFPYKSVSQSLDEEVRNHLSTLAEKAIKSDLIMNVIGHTDHMGSESYNKRLGMERAETIAEMLRGYGVQNRFITVSSKGEEEPLMADGQADEASMNRRVEIILGPSKTESHR